MAGRPITKTQAEIELAKAKTRLIRLEARSEELHYERMRRFVAAEEADASLHRVYTFYGKVDEDIVADCMAELGEWSRRDPGKPITLILNSPGGDCIHGIALYDFLLWLRAEGHHLTAIVLGEASSMGGIILQAADHRVMGRTSEMLIHEVSAWGVRGTTSSIEDYTTYLRKLNDRLFAVLAERSTLTMKEILRRAKKTDWILTADEALALGFVDAVR